MGEMLEIACDESGHTGPDLLNKDQRYFAYASVSIGDEEAYEIIHSARKEHPVQMPELKAKALMSTGRGRELIGLILSKLEGRYTVNVHDKLLALCAWFFEYIYEPVYQDDPWLLYEKNFHRFVAMYSWLWMMDDESQARKAIKQFQAYMRSRDPSDAPFLFEAPRKPLSEDGTEHPFEGILHFAYGYRDIIIADNARLDKELPDDAKWTLDLSVSALWSHLNHWGTKGKPLSVKCDQSKPLEASIGNFSGDENDPGIRRARWKGNTESLGWTLAKPISFVDSRNHPSVQIADIIAGATVAIYSNELPDNYHPIAELLAPHLHPHSITPDLEIIDPSNRTAAVNALIAYDLAKRAEKQGDPYKDLAEMYFQAEVAWVKGEFKPFQKDRTSKS